MAKWNVYAPKSGERAANMAAAKKIFEMQKLGRPFTDQVMRAARRILQYIATQYDIDLIRKTMGMIEIYDVNTPGMTRFLGSVRNASRNAKKYKAYNRRKGKR